MSDPSSFLQWLHESYSNLWQGTVDIATVPAQDHTPKNPHWISTITASGAVVQSEVDGKNHTLEPIRATAHAQTKQAAEQAAAEKIFRQLVQEGWWDPEVSPFDQLDTPCLIRVLNHVSPQKQLVACGAVCSKWRKATREAITGIHISTGSQQKYDQLQQWLVYPPATLYKLSLHGRISGQQPGLRLQLSVLQHLRELALNYGVRLEAVAADGSVLEVVNLLPMLQQCTKLTFRAWEDPQLTPAAAAFQAMPALQDLDIDGEDAGLPESLVALPTTLTRLYLCHDGDINASNAATIGQLTGLRVLEVSSDSFDTSILANCAGLERVKIKLDGSLSGNEGPTLPEGFTTTPLLVFANMSSLQHLEFQLQDEYDYKDPVATAPEVAALSASSNLTYLSLHHCEYCALPPAAYDTWFPAGRCCPYLEHVDMGEWVLGNIAAVLRMVSACPGLKQLKLRSAANLGDQPESTCVTASLQALTNLTALTRLCVDGRQLPAGVCISPAVISAWSQMTSLQQLDVRFQADWWPSHMQDVLRLTQLRSLRELTLEEHHERVSSGYTRIYVFLVVKSQVGGPPDVWRQLPSALWSAAIEHQQKQIRQLQQQQQQKQSDAAALLEQQKAAETLAATLLQQQAAAEANAAALRQQHAAAQSQLIALQQQQATAQAQVLGLLQQQQQAETVMLRQEQQDRQEQQEEMAVLRQQAESGQTQLSQLQGQVASLQATQCTLGAPGLTQGIT